MQRTLNKEFLFESFFNISGTHEVRKIAKLLGDIDKVAYRREFDKDLENMRTALNLWVAEDAGAKFEKLNSIAKPVFDYLRKNQDWSFTDIVMLSSVISAANTFDEAVAFTERALETMDAQHTQEEKYWNCRFAIQSNVLPRILRARFFGESEKWKESDPETIDQAFNKYFSYALKTCEENKFTVHKLCCLLRKALYDSNYEEVENVLKRMKTLKKADEKHAYKIAVKEVIAYHRLLGHEVSVKHLNFITGYFITKRREELDFSRAYMAQRLKVGELFYAQAERGEKRFSDVDKYKIAHILGVDMNYLFYGDEELPPPPDINFENGLSPEDIAILYDNLSPDAKESFEGFLMLLRGK